MGMSTFTYVLMMGAVLLSVSPAMARRGLQVVAKIDLTYKKPDFSRATPVKLMSQGALLYLGKGIWKKQQTLHFFRLADNKRFTVEAPLDGFLRSPKYTHIAGDRRSVHKRFLLEKVVYYDEKSGEAGLQVTDHNHRQTKERRTFLLRWDLRKKKILDATMLGKKVYREPSPYFIPLYFDPIRREMFYAMSWKAENGHGRLVIRGYSEGKTRVVTRFKTKRRLGSHAFPDRAQNRVLLVEYAESGDERLPPRGYLVDTTNGKMMAMDMPLTAYGVAFAPGDKQIFSCSAQRGSLWTIDALRGKKLKSRRIGKLCHAMGFIDDKRVVVIRNAGLHVFRLTPRGLRRDKTFRTKTFHRGFVNTGGSLLAPGRVLVQIGSTLYVIAIP